MCVKVTPNASFPGMVVLGNIPNLGDTQEGCRSDVEKGGAVFAMWNAFSLFSIESLYVQSS